MSKKFAAAEIWTHDHLHFVLIFVFIILLDILNFYTLEKALNS